jgi:murein hydrolase activator
LTVKLPTYCRRSLLAALTLSAVLAVPHPGAAQAPDRARTEALARRATARLQALQREADALAAQERSLLVDLRRLEVERDLKTETLRQIDADLDQIARDLGDASRQIEALETQERAQLPGLNARLVEMYKLGNAGYLRLLLTVEDLRELGRAYRMVSALAVLDRQRVTDHRRRLEALRAARAALEQRSATMAALQGEARTARAAIERAALARSQLIAQIDARRDLTAELAGELQTAQQRLQQALGSMGGAGAGAGSEAPSLPIRPFRGDLDWPVAGRLAGRFGARGGSPVASTIARNGVEIAAAAGASVRAVHEGTVAFADSFTGYGNLVVIDHGSQAYSLYGQLSSIGVERGARVDRGQPIGTAGRVLAGTPGIYFELRVDGKPVDPIEWLKSKQP